MPSDLNPRRVGILIAALADYDRAEFGQLNATAEALKRAAMIAGWREGDGPCAHWVRAIVEKPPCK